METDLKTAVQGDGWSLELPDGFELLERSDGPGRVERFVEFRSEDLGAVGRIVVEQAPGEMWPADSSFAIASQDFSSREDFAWERRLSVNGQYADPVQFGQFRFGATRGLLATASLGNQRTATLLWLFPEALIETVWPIAVASLDSFVGEADQL